MSNEPCSKKPTKNFEQRKAIRVSADWKAVIISQKTATILLQKSCFLFQIHHYLLNSAFSLIQTLVSRLISESTRHLHNPESYGTCLGCAYRNISWKNATAEQSAFYILYFCCFFQKRTASWKKAGIKKESQDIKLL